MKSFIDRFNNMKMNGKHIQYALDIGAYRGDFTRVITSVWPTARVKQFEADERQLPWLDSINAPIIALLGDKDLPEVEFHTLDQDKITTGSSIFKELTPHYSEKTTRVIKCPMTTIDTLAKTYNFYGNWKDLGLIKIDTQGSELLILEGAKEFIRNKQPKYILLECSVQQYNEGAPLMTDVVSYMNRIGYIITDVFDLSYTAKGELLQMDILFDRVS